jgi:hypothetical protein
MKHALAFAFAALGCAGAETVTISPAQPAAPPAEVNLDARPAPQPSAQPQAPTKPPEAPPPSDQKEEAQFGMIGLINPGASGDPNAVQGNMWGTDVGDSFGTGGLGISGVGLGGGGTGEGTIGLGSIGALGHGSGTGQGFGGANRKTPVVKMGATTVLGRLPPEVIQRIVRQNFGRFRLCYENGLRNDPKLEGKIAVRFIIETNGSVGNVGDAGSSMPDKSVISCVARAFSTLSFPQPEGGKVIVTYPIQFSPGDAAPPPRPTPPAQGAAKPADTGATKKP